MIFQIKIFKNVSTCRITKKNKNKKCQVKNQILKKKKNKKKH